MSIFDDPNSVAAVGTSCAKILRIWTHRRQHDTTQATLVETYQPLTVHDYRSNKGCYIAVRTMDHTPRLWTIWERRYVPKSILLGYDISSYYVWSRGKTCDVYTCV